MGRHLPSGDCSCCAAAPCECPPGSDFASPTVLSGTRTVVSGVPGTFYWQRRIDSTIWDIPFSGPPCFTIDSIFIRQATVTGLSALNGTFLGSLIGTGCPKYPGTFSDPCQYLISPSVFCTWDFPILYSISVDVEFYYFQSTTNNNTGVTTTTEYTVNVTGTASFGRSTTVNPAGHILRIQFTDPTAGTGASYGHQTSATDGGFSNTSAGVDSLRLEAVVPPIYEVECEAYSSTRTAINTALNTDNTVTSLTSSATCNALGHRNSTRTRVVADGYTVVGTTETYV